jgi:DNA polymerase type B, organellar and viral
MKYKRREETLKYLESDLLCLYQVIIQFSDNIFKLEKLNITKILSISSLTFKLFKTNYLNDFKLSIVKGIHHDKIIDPFYSGHVDVYTPIGNNIYYYDVNSLYLFVMANNDYPIGEPILLFDKDLNNYFGIIHCKITTPEYMDKPVLPFRGEDGTIYYPIGN